MDADTAQVAIFAVAMISSLVLHEFAHATTAFWLGDTTAAYQGRLTLNPLAHIDPFYSILLPIMLYLATGIPLGGAKPVPVNPQLIRRTSPSRGMMLIAAAGPLANFVLAILALALLYLCSHLEWYKALPTLIIFYMVNIGLGIFNLLPIPPLDGSRVLNYFLSYRHSLVMAQIAPYGMFILYFLIWTGVVNTVTKPLYLFFSNLIPFPS